VGDRALLTLGKLTLLEENDVSMEQHALKNINNCLNANIYSYLETSGGQSSKQYLKVAHFFNNIVN
jgi:hypothetical protein